MATPSIPARVVPADPLGTLYSRLTITAAGVLAVVFIVGHIPLVKQSLDGIDSTNFVLAIDGYDPRLHQPHPPGFPVHVAFGRLVTSAYRAVVPAAEHEIDTAATSLRIWSALSGSLTVVAMMWVALGTGMSRSRAALATALVTLCPLFWITAMRPLSDVPGLLFAMISQALALAAYNGARPAALPAGNAEMTQIAPAGYRWPGAAFVAGLAVGVRVQTSLLTLPLLAVLVVLHVRRAGPQIVPVIAAAFSLGVLAWAVPLAFTLGGPGEYFRLLMTVAADDVQGVEMIATQFSPRLLARALDRTFVAPWGSLTLGALVVGAVILGAMSCLKWNRRVLAYSLIMGGPYLVFHLLFQETVSIRYALPLVPMVAMLLVGGSGSRAGWLWAAAVTGVVVLSSMTSVKASMAYARTQSPVARAFQDATVEADRRSTPPTFASHHSVGRAVRAESWPGRVLDAPVRYEWIELANHWLGGGRGPVWFLADGRRTDLALIDPSARRLVSSYRWPVEAESLLGGMQPARVTSYEIAPPGWFLMRGWSLTPETAGVSSRDGKAAGAGGALGYLRRRPGAAMMLIGGRNLGGPCDTAAEVQVSIDGQPRASWAVPSRSTFLQTVTLAAGELDGETDFAELEVVARDVTGAGRLVDVALEQFDVQTAGAAMTGFGRGWHMPELDAASGMSWRWTDDVAETAIEAFGRDVQLSIHGESPLRYFQVPPKVLVKAGSTTLASFRPTDDFHWTVRVPAATLAAADGRVLIETDRTFVPDDTTGNGDRRRLALRIFAVSATPVTGPR